MPATRSHSTNLVSQSLPAEDMKPASSPRSTSESRSLSRNAQAQARLRARRRAHVESLEAEIKRLQSIVDATALHPSRNSQTSTNNSSPLGVYSSPVPSLPSNAEAGSSSRPLDTIQLRHDNERLRRERDAFRVQVEALMGYISRGCALPSSSPIPNSMTSPLFDLKRPGFASCEIEQGDSPDLHSEMDSEDQQSQDPFSQSPFIPPGAYTKDETSQLLSLYGSNLAFLRHFDLHAQGPALFSIGDKPIQLPVLPGSNLWGAIGAMNTSN
ncbi:hypothetical protein ACGC1H_003994 [Rhizoctonia solani]